MKTMATVKELFLKSEPNQDYGNIFCILTSIDHFSTKIPENLNHSLDDNLSFSGVTHKNYNLFYDITSAQEDVPSVKLFKQDTLFMVSDKFEIVIRELLTNNRKAEFEIEEYSSPTPSENGENSTDKKSSWNIVGITLGI